MRGGVAQPLGGVPHGSGWPIRAVAAVGAYLGNQALTLSGLASTNFLAADS